MGLQLCEYLDCVNGTTTTLDFNHHRNNGNPRISGSIPTQIGLNTNLTSLNLYGNPLSGTIPTQFGLLTKLSYTDLGASSYSGTLPSELGSLKSLSGFSIRYNTGISGTLPTELGMLSKLTQLISYRLSLSGTVPSQLANVAGWCALTYRQSRITTAPNTNHFSCPLPQLGNACDNRLTCSYLPSAPPPLLPPSHPPPYFPPPFPSSPSPPSSPPPPGCSSSTGHTYAYPCCTNPSSSYGGMWVNARWIGAPWFAYACSCIIPQGTLIPVGSASVDYCCYRDCS